MPEGQHVTVERGINALVELLVGESIADDQNYAYISGSSGDYLVTFPSVVEHSYVLRDRPYEETYRELVESRSYNLRLLDGGLVQFSYRFLDGALVWHRLAFMPNPTLEPYQNEPEIYRRDSLYGDVLDAGVVTVPLRFDYDPGAANDAADHPASHLTLGQYKNCRIPVSRPVSPSQFLTFVLRSFYSMAFASLGGVLRQSNFVAEECLSTGDAGRMHVRIP